MQSEINAASSEYVYGFDTPQNGFSKKQLADAFEEGIKWQSDKSEPYHTTSDKGLIEFAEFCSQFGKYDGEEWNNHDHYNQKGTTDKLLKAYRNQLKG